MKRHVLPGILVFIGGPLGCNFRFARQSEPILHFTRALPREWRRRAGPPSTALALALAVVLACCNGAAAQVIEMRDPVLRSGALEFALPPLTHRNYRLEESFDLVRWVEADLNAIRTQSVKPIDGAEWPLFRVTNSGVARFLRVSIPTNTIRILSQPADVNAKAGQNVVFSVEAAGEIVRYHWLSNGVPIATAGGVAAPWATNASLVVIQPASGTLALYAVDIYGRWETVRSGAARLYVEQGDFAPAVLAGAVAKFSIASGTPPFASAGTYFAAASATGSNYVVVPLDFPGASSGLYEYRRLLGDLACLRLGDSFQGWLNGELFFDASAAGRFQFAIGDFRQRGTFELVVQSPDAPADLAPSSIRGESILIGITGGTGLFEPSGSYRFRADAAGNGFQILFLTATETSSGTYDYRATGSDAASLTVDDSGVGAARSELRFISHRAGTITIASTVGNGSQTGTFLIE